MYEELLADTDATVATPIAQLRIARLEQRSRLPSELLSLPGSGCGDEAGRAVHALLGRHVPEYRPSSTQ